MTKLITLHGRPCRAAMPCPRNLKAICCDDLTGCGITFCNFIVHGPYVVVYMTSTSLSNSSGLRLRMRLLPFLFYILHSYLPLVPGYLNTHLFPFTQPAAVVHTCNKNLCFTHHCLFLFTFFRCITVAFPHRGRGRFSSQVWNQHLDPALSSF